MNFDFTSGRITIVVAPIDMRSGYARLSFYASAVLDIDVDKGEDFVVFISRRRQIVKMIWRDERGSAVLTRRLNTGRFEQFLVRANQNTVALTADDLMSFLDGEPIFEKP